MHKHFYSLILSLVFVINCFANDKIYLNNGLIIDGTITQIDIETVTIEYGDNELTRTLHKDAIKVIIYEDGTAVTFPKIDTVKVDSRKIDVKITEVTPSLSLEDRMIKTEKNSARIYGFLGGIACCVGLYLVFVIIVLI